MTHIHYRRPCVRYSVRPSVHRMLLPVLRLNDKAMVDIRLRPAGAAAWWINLSWRHTWCVTLWATMTSSTKPEVHNALQWRHAEDRATVTWRNVRWKFVEVSTRGSWDMIADRQTDGHGDGRTHSSQYCDPWPGHGVDISRLCSVFSYHPYERRSYYKHLKWKQKR